jgi:Raf kinase inhibitor-like YbhB/YbcL family protein
LEDSVKGNRIYLIIAALIVLGAGGCKIGEAVPTVTIVQPTATLPPTQTPPPPTVTPLPPTATPLPPSETPIPSTETPLPQSETPSPTDTLTPEPIATLDPAIFELRSPAFGRDETIPAKYTCDELDISPPLEWGDPPEGTVSLAIVMDDITASNFVHWLFFNIPPETRSLPAGIDTVGHFEDGSQQGTNHIFALGYFGPCPQGSNRYRIRLFALDAMLDLEDGVMMIPLKQAMMGHVLAETELYGVYR